MATRPGPETRVPSRAHAAMLCVTLAVGLSSSCAEPFTPTCRVAEETFVVLDTALPVGQTGASVPLLGEREDGTFEATWLSSTTVRHRNQPVAVVSRADLVTVPPDGKNARRFAFVAPSALRARRGSTTPLGALLVDEGVLFPWIEEEVSTQRDGTRSTNGLLRSQLVRFDGSEGAVESPSSMRCEDCKLAASFAATAGRAAIVLTMTFRDGSKKVESAAYSGRGTVTHAEELTWARVPPPKAGETPSMDQDTSSFDPSYAIDVVAGGYVVQGPALVALFDTDLLPRWPAPLAVPSGARVGSAGTDLLFVWPEPVADGTLLRDDSSIGRGEGRGIFFERRSLRTGAPTGTPLRLSVGAAVIGVVPRGAVLRTSDGVDYFAHLTETGVKRGGDVRLPDVRGAELAQLGVDRTRAHTFVDMRVAPGMVFRRSIVCEP